MEFDQSDDVSALSMDGASAIAGMGLAKRLRKDFAKMQLGIPEDEEQQAVAAAVVVKSNPRNSSNGESPSRTNNGEELLEPFPKTFEEWQKKKEKKHKSKKHHKKSSKSGSRSSKSRDKQPREQEQDVENVGTGKAPPPIMEISIQSTNFQTQSTNFQSAESAPSPSRRRSDQTENASDLRSAPSIASTAESSRSRSGIAAATSSSHQRRHSSSFQGQGSAAMRMAIKRSLISQQKSSFRSMASFRSAESHESLTHMTGQSSRQKSAFRSTDHQSSSRSAADSHESMTHMTGQSSVSQSHVTVEDLQHLRSNLKCAKMEENQVLEIHERLEKEVQSAMQKAEKTKSHQQTVSFELEAASLEREYLQNQLGKLHDENNKLLARLRHLEDREAAKGLDNALDSMEAKIKELKFKSRRSKERRSVDDG
mmetsp:Transcript_10720/g.23743  ORF Transcript_10720/g.23743 Transcript_10720/m.23743 type:complete len:425 (-) Transcript_10720:189-1463(-)|eukprot:CAMPEP_0172322494 /NCGR_PEP_ID=MMETSP1058-20130122/46057_1 /TAXON_ID=83371 /ORGANISM="Detonula confervacea, Strain CCMP 353" /LENGTH=424 /DNA_ID=CAMNT_0013038253 /DNA_START=183 /DNA_END=1457 /DNA_ORIENTATION=-